MPKDWVLGRSESGCMRGDIFFEYICNDFNKWRIENKIKKPVLLLVDGHKSHMKLPLSEFCESNGIILYTLPPRTTHILQPADVSVFRLLKQGWKNTVREFHFESENPWNSAVTEANFCPLFAKVINAFDMPQQIKNGFKKCGLFPLDEEAVDYTKCDNTKLRNQRSSTGITSTEIDIAIKVIQAANLYAKHGIDTNLILRELNDMK
ncbi:unnamed protein product [Parnassius mnemosyne]|uniref:DDE-1 domain-containing protein n=1 Tax=Parnassius mnemosyne TaxID=213953 RepID=A0AAV1LXF5_9NEOP